MACSRSSVRWSTLPVTGMSRFSWKPRTASTVAASYVPVTSPNSHAIETRRAWRSRTCSPLSPASRIAGPGCRTLKSWSCVGVFVIRTSRRQVRSSTTPVALRRRFSWKPVTPSRVAGVVPAGGQLGEPGELEEPRLQLAHLDSPVALLEPELGLRLALGSVGLGVSRRVVRPTPRAAPPGSPSPPAARRPAAARPRRRTRPRPAGRPSTGPAAPHAVLSSRLSQVASQNFQCQDEDARTRDLVALARRRDRVVAFRAMCVCDTSSRIADVGSELVDDPRP